MRCIGDYRAGHAARILAGQRYAPCNRAAPVMPDDGEVPHVERSGQQENIAHQLVGRVVGHRLRLGRSAIAALIGRDAAEAVGEMRDLMAPGAVALGKAVQEDQDRRVARPFIDHIEFDSIAQRNPLLFQHHGHSSAFIFSM